MKKLFVLLLAFAAVGAMIAEEAAAPAVTTAVSVWGENGLYNNGTDNFLGGNNGIDLDFDANSEKFGFSTELEFVQDGTPTALGDTLYFNYAYGWYQPIDMVKINFGYIWNSSYRLRDSQSQYIGGGLCNDNGLLIELFPIEGLSVALNVPLAADKSFATGAPGYTVKMADALKNPDIFAKYAMKDVGDFYLSYAMADKNSKFGVAANLKMIPNVTAQLGFYYAGIGAAATTGQDISVMSVLGYKMTPFTFTEEFDIFMNTSDPETKALGWKTNTIVAFKPANIRYQATINASNKRLTANDYINYSAEAAARFYEGSNYLNVAFKYYGSTQDGAKATWKIPVGYSVAF